MPDTPNRYDAPPEFQAGMLAQQVPRLLDQNTQLQVEVAYRDQLLAAKDTRIAELEARVGQLESQVGAEDG